MGLGGDDGRWPPRAPPLFPALPPPFPASCYPARPALWPANVRPRHRLASSPWASGQRSVTDGQGRHRLGQDSRMTVTDTVSGDTVRGPST